jgi:hypothetical protein
LHVALVFRDEFFKVFISFGHISRSDVSDQGRGDIEDFADHDVKSFQKILRLIIKSRQEEH